MDSLLKRHVLSAAISMVVLGVLSALLSGGTGGAFPVTFALVAVTHLLWIASAYYNSRHGAGQKSIVPDSIPALLDARDADGTAYPVAVQIDRLVVQFERCRGRIAASYDALLAQRDVIGATARNSDTSLTAMASNIEQVSSELRDFSEKLHSLSSAIEESSAATLELGASIEEVSENISRLFNYIDNTSTAIFELVTIAREMDMNVDSLKKITEETNTFMTQMVASVKEVETKAVEAARYTEGMEQDAQLGKDAIEKVELSMNGINEANSFTFNSLSELNLDIKSVSQILKVIEDIAEETSLLALNAAIIAAQSGEQGKAFAVVAEEIKELAERTGLSTKEISAIISNILAKSERAGVAITQSTKAIEVGVESTNHAGDTFRNILTAINGADQRVGEIAKANVEQSKGVGHITRLADQISVMVDGFVRAIQEQKKGAEQIISSTERVKEIANFARNSTAEQNSTSKQIGKSVVDINEMAHFFKNQLNQFRSDFDGIARGIVSLKPDTRNMLTANDEASEHLQAIGTELHTLETTIRDTTGKPQSR